LSSENWHCGAVDRSPRDYWVYWRDLRESRPSATDAGSASDFIEQHKLMGKGVWANIDVHLLRNSTGLLEGEGAACGTAR